MSDRADFMTLRDTPLHALRGAEWPAYYAQLTPYLQDASADIRAMAVERYMMAVFRAETFDPAFAQDRARTRVATFLADVEQAHASHPDVLPEVLRGFRWHGDDHQFPSLLAPWLAHLQAAPPRGVDPGLITGAQILIGDGEHQLTEPAAMIKHLDGPSDWVRGCAARRLGDCLDADATQAVLVHLAALEIARPGVAGPFCASHYSGCSYEPWGNAEGLTEWLQHLLEARQGPVPADMPYNDIAFYLHELCSRSPERVKRMIDHGFFGLALETALEDPDQWPHMRPLMQLLTACADPQISQVALRILASR